jgi:hypothetical protein
MIIYEGKNVHTVTRRENRGHRHLLHLGPSLKVWSHSPTGFSWGYGGSGPAQLALALLLDVTGDAELSTRLHQDFKWAFVAGWSDGWQITSDGIIAWVTAKLSLALKAAKAEEKRDATCS